MQTDVTTVPTIDMTAGPGFHFAELNVARLHRPLDEPDNAEFVAALDAVNLIAERTPGFVWRLQDEDGASSSYVTAYDDPLVIVNLTVWRDVESLRHFAYKSGHGAYLRRRREWFEAPRQAQMVCWWIPVEETPTVDDAVRRLERLRAEGPSPEGFLFTDPYPLPATSANQP